MRKLAIASAALLGVLMLTAAAAHARGWGPGHGMMDPAKVDKFVTFRVNDMLDDIKATDSQRSQVLAIKDQLLPQGMELMKANREAHHQAMQLLQGTTVDKSQLDAIVDARIDAIRAFAHEVTFDIVKIHDLLNTEQRAALQQKIAEHHRGPWSE